ncbi:MAG: DUF971 domain-containing protein [Gammaproteobacteria bacterium]|nr:DUF971 domain-containing protein [Gammaproteobacteria bacterium]
MIPEEIRLSKDKQSLHLRYGDDEVRFSAQWLRVNSPSAEVQGHGPGQKVTVTGKENVRIVDIAPVGNYAVKLTFDDGHDSGLFSWDYFYDHKESP